MVGEGGLEGTLRHAYRHGIRMRKWKVPNHSCSRHVDGRGGRGRRLCLYVLDASASASIWG